MVKPEITARGLDADECAQNNISKLEKHEDHKALRAKARHQQDKPETHHQQQDRQSVINHRPRAGRRRLDRLKDQHQRAEQDQETRNGYPKHIA